MNALGHFGKAPPITTDSKPIIYLCGPIGGRTVRDATSWRDEATQLLMPEFEVLSPLRDLHPPSFSVPDEVIAARETSKRFTPAEIVERDLMDIRRSYLVLRHYLGPSEGSPMECVYAKLFGVPVVVSGVPDALDASPWLRYHAVRLLPTVAMAVEYIKTYWGTATAADWQAR